MKTMKKQFPGTLFLVVGNSGSGKDSIISGAIKKYPPNLKPIHLAKRYITRVPSEFEDNYSITVEQFKEMNDQGKFALKWHIYELDYGVPIEIEEFLKEGYQVVVNVSRTIIDEVREKYKNVKVVFVKVPFDITLQRVTSRGRENGELLNERIERAKSLQKLPEVDFVIDNSGNLESAINQFLNILIEAAKESE